MVILLWGGAFGVSRRGDDAPAAASTTRPQAEATPPVPAGLSPGGGAAPRGGKPGEAGAPEEVGGGGGVARNTRTRGTVVDEEDGRPIVGATVRGEADVEGAIDLGPAAVTDARGWFEAVVANDDGAHLVITAPGYRERFVYKHPTGAETAILLRREDRARVRLRLSGEVADGDRLRLFLGDEAMTVGGAPPPWTFGHTSPPPPLEAWDSEAAQLTVEGGGIEVPGPLGPGVVRLFVAGERGSAGPSWIHVPPRAGTLEVALRLRPKVRVDALVTRAGQPVEGVALFLGGEGISRDLASATTDAGGRAALVGFDVPGRRVHVVAPVTASVPLADGAQSLAIELQPLEAARDEALARVAAVREPPPPSPPAPGEVLVSPPPPLPPDYGVPFASSPKPSPGRLTGVIEFEGWPPIDRGFPTAVPEPGADGPPWPPVLCGFGGPDFTFGALLPGRYRIVLRCGALVATSDGPVEVRSGETTDVGSLPLRRGASLLGRVLDAAGAPRPFTRVVVADDRGALSLPVWTDPDGGYRVEGLWPGVWTVSVGGDGGLEPEQASTRVSGSAEHRLDLRARGE